MGSKLAASAEAAWSDRLQLPNLLTRAEHRRPAALSLLPLSCPACAAPFAYPSPAAAHSPSDEAKRQRPA